MFHGFSQHQYAPTDWHMPQPQSQQQSHHGHQHPAQAQAAAAAAVAHQQQHYNRLTSTSNSTAASSAIGAGDRSQSFGGGVNADHNANAEERRVLEWVAQLMNPTLRERALLELSKKREQFPQLALILWHSFGGLNSLSLASVLSTEDNNCFPLA